MSKAHRRYADGRIATTGDGSAVRYDAGGRPHSAADRSALVDAVTWQIAKDDGLRPDDPDARRRAEEIVREGEDRD